MRLVADANVLLSAVGGGRARLVLSHPGVGSIHTPRTVLDELYEHLAGFALSRGLPADLLLMTAAALPVTVVPPEIYAASLPEARRRIGRRDPDDVDALALALHLDAAVWSNDDDFRGTEVPWFTTARLLAHLGVRS